MVESQQAKAFVQVLQTDSTSPFYKNKPNKNTEPNTGKKKVRTNEEHSETGDFKNRVLK